MTILSFPGCQHSLPWKPRCDVGGRCLGMPRLTLQMEVRLEGRWLGWEAHGHLSRRGAAGRQDISHGHGCLLGFCFFSGMANELPHASDTSTGCMPQLSLPWAAGRSGHEAEDLALLPDLVLASGPRALLLYPRTWAIPSETQSRDTTSGLSLGCTWV